MNEPAHEVLVPVLIVKAISKDKPAQTYSLARAFAAFLIQSLEVEECFGPKISLVAPLDSCTYVIIKHHDLLG